MTELNRTDKIFHSKTALFFSNAHGTFSRVDHILGHKSNLGKLKKKNEIISSIFSDHNVIITEGETIKDTNIWRIWNNNQMTEEIKKMKGNQNMKINK